MRVAYSIVLLTGLTFAGFSVATVDVVAQDVRESVDFTRDVRPILSNACFHCHGPDEDTREAELRLDQRDGLFEHRDEYTIVNPGDHSGSELIRRILSHDPDEVMPPADSTKSLTEQQKRILVRWVEQGAEWKEHWAFVPPTRSVVPDVSRPEWCRNEIDRFTLAQMDRAGLTPSGEAAPYTLIRRLYLDLIGLPPTPQEAEAWAEKIWHSNGTDEAAYQTLVDHLLHSPHYGERAARRWLDLARYADTNGYEKDRERSVWPYRDWVINAINDGMPFDRFTIEQLAGDMLPYATREQRVATGFHRNTMLNEEGGIDPLEFRFHAMTDRVATTGTTWLGLTLSCCQCHSHKYDPVSHREYYQLMAYLNNADEPSLQLPDESFERTWAANQEKADQLMAALPQKWPIAVFAPVGVQVVSTTADGGQTFRTREDAFIEVGGENPERATYVVDLELASAEFDTLTLSTKAVRKQAGPGRTMHGNFVLSEIEVDAVHDSTSDGTSDTTKLTIKSATASAEQSGYVARHAIDGNAATGWGIHDDRGVGKTAKAIFVLDTSNLSQRAKGPVRLRVTLKQLLGRQHTIGAFKLAASRTGTQDELQEARGKLMQVAFDQWQKDEAPNAVEWKPLTPISATSNLPVLTIQDDDSVFASGDTAKRDHYYITVAPSATPIAALRLETLPDDRLPAGGPGSTYYEGTLGDFFLVEIGATAGEANVPFVSASHTYAKNRYGNNPVSAALAIDGDVQTGWSVHARQGERHDAVFVFREPVPAGTALNLKMTFGRHFASSLGRFRFSATAARSEPQARSYSDEVSRLLARPDLQYRPAEREQMWNAFLLSAPQLSSQSEQIRKLRSRPATKSTLVMAERPAQHPRPTHRHHRGEYLQPREPVQPGLPAVLSGDKDDLPATRLEFATWIVSPENPLTARVVVNRQWAALFGTGIVKTVDDLGLQGESPSHPRLLDWLAVTFRDVDAWSLRKLHRRIVSSSTYRQTASVSSEAANVDPQNRLLSFAPRYRLDAEVIRDQLLVASGVLSAKIGGPSVRPPQPAGVTEAAYGGARWNAGKGDDRYRRSLYTYAKRTAPFAMLSTFDGPSGEACVARRNRSNSPLQALTLLNDVMLMDLARQAARLLTADSERADSERMTMFFRRVLVRRPTDEELDSLLSFLDAQRHGFLASPESAQELLSLTDEQAAGINVNRLASNAAWAATARALFGLDETLTRE
ncbi:MAG: PSD1 and planctomycete cytochrome C domain-containing protein [Fuerstiella sp.]|nr:PSD1 and planctomycete cytochrome C domain-containing protein [Fuerstiella sp.]